MADEPETTETEDAAPSNAELDQRIDGLDSKLSMILDKLSGTEGKAHAEAQRQTQDHLDRSSSIAEQIRRQFAEEKAKEAADAEKRGQADRLAAVEQSMAEMREVTPEAPVRRVEKIMGWH